MKLFKKLKVWALKKDNDGEIAREIVEKIGKKKAYLVAIFCVIFALGMSRTIFSILPDIYIFDDIMVWVYMILLAHLFFFKFAYEIIVTYNKNSKKKIKTDKVPFKYMGVDLK